MDGQTFIKLNWIKENTLSLTFSFTIEQPVLCPLKAARTRGDLVTAYAASIILGEFNLRGYEKE